MTIAYNGSNIKGWLPRYHPAKHESQNRKQYDFTTTSLWKCVFHRDERHSKADHRQFRRSKVVDVKEEKYQKFFKWTSDNIWHPICSNRMQQLVNGNAQIVIVEKRLLPPIGRTLLETLVTWIKQQQATNEKEDCLNTPEQIKALVAEEFPVLTTRIGQSENYPLNRI